MQKLILPAIIMFFIFSGAWFLAHTPEPMTMGEGEEREEKTGSWIDKYEWLLSRDPNTGKIPEGIRPIPANRIAQVEISARRLADTRSSDEHESVHPDALRHRQFLHLLHLIQLELVERVCPPQAGRERRGCNGRPEPGTRAQLAEGADDEPHHTERTGEAGEFPDRAVDLLQFRVCAHGYVGV